MLPFLKFFLVVDGSVEKVSEFFELVLSKMALRHELCIYDLPFLVKEDKNTVQNVAWAREES